MTALRGPRHASVFAATPVRRPGGTGRECAHDRLLAPALEGLRPWDTLCFSSDYPHWDIDEPRQTLKRLPAEWREGVAHRNATAFFGLPAAVAA